MDNTKEARLTEVEQAKKQTKLLFGLAAFLSFLVSIGLWFTGSKEAGLYVGLWVPSILAAGTFMLVGEEK